MPKGPGRQHDLSTVMCFVGDEIAEDVPDVQRKIAPPIGPGRRDIPTVITAELQEMGDPVPAASQGGQELPGCDPPPINRGWHGLAVGHAEGPDPHAPRVVNVAGDHADRAARCPWQGGDPEVGRQLQLPSFVQHLSVLERSRLVRSTKRGRVRTYEIAPERFAVVEDWLTARRRLWEARLDRFDQYVNDLKAKESES